MGEDFKYDVALSFAGEQRYYVEVVARALQDFGVSVFYDELESAQLWGTDGIEELERRYAEEAFRVVMFISDDYVRKGWPSIERRSTFGRLLKSPDSNHVLPVRFDDTPVPGLPPQKIVKWVDGVEPVQLAESIVDHLIVVGRVPASTRNTAAGPKAKAALVGFTSMAELLPTGFTRIDYRIHNGCAFTIDSVVVVVPDYSANPEASPDNQRGCAMEMVIGPVAAGQTVEDHFEVRLSSEPVFAELPYVAHLLWTDNDDNHWAACGSDVRRRWSRARTC